LIGAPYRTSKVGSNAPPGIPNIISTFSLIKLSIKICAPLSFTVSPPSPAITEYAPLYLAKS
jgi:hypothetical protein